jgi:hypothetical protein
MVPDLVGMDYIELSDMPPDSPRKVSRVRRPQPGEAVLRKERRLESIGISRLELVPSGGGVDTSAHTSPY